MKNAGAKAVIEHLITVQCRIYLTTGHRGHSLTFAWPHLASSERSEYWALASTVGSTFTVNEREGVLAVYLHPLR